MDKIPKGPLTLYSEEDWRMWIWRVSLVANQHDVWRYINPTVPKYMRHALPQRPIMPSLSEFMEDAVDIGDLDKKVARKWSVTYLWYQYRRDIYEKVASGLAVVTDLIFASVAAHNLSLVLGMSDVGDMLEVLQNRFEPAQRFSQF